MNNTSNESINDTSSLLNLSLSDIPINSFFWIIGIIFLFFLSLILWMFWEYIIDYFIRIRKKGVYKKIKSDYESLQKQHSDLKGRLEDANVLIQELRKTNQGLENKNREYYTAIKYLSGKMNEFEGQHRAILDMQIRLEKVEKALNILNSQMIRLGNNLELSRDLPSPLDQDAEDIEDDEY